LAQQRKWLPILWGVGIGVAAGSYLWGSSAGAGLVAGDKIIFTLVIPMVVLLACLAISLASAGRGAGPPDRP
jgi:hypothetical protein